MEVNGYYQNKKEEQKIMNGADQNTQSGQNVQTATNGAVNSDVGNKLYPSLGNHDTVSASTQQHNMQHYYNGQTQPPSYDEIHRHNAHRDSRFGLIRGYHQQMYEPTPQPLQCCDCSGMQSRHDAKDPKCNWGVICGILLLILGILALTMGFTLPQKTPSFDERRNLTDKELQDLQRIQYYVEIFIIGGLAVLSLGGIVISAGILYPLCRKGRDSYEESYFNKYYGSEVYVKKEDLAPLDKQVVNFGFHKDVVPSDMMLRRIQPETRQSAVSTMTTK